jgi:hypothetical protein
MSLLLQLLLVLVSTVITPLLLKLAFRSDKGQVVGDRGKVANSRYSWFQPDPWQKSCLKEVRWLP